MLKLLVASWDLAERATVSMSRHKQNPTHTKTSSLQNGNLIKRMRKKCNQVFFSFAPPPER